MSYAFYSLLRCRVHLIIIISFLAATAVFLFGCGLDNLSGSSSPAPINPAIEFVGHSGCMMTADKSPDYLEKCIALEYDGSGELRLVSIGSWFNCCPDSLEGDISFEDRTISIIETEYLGPLSGCDCICPFDFTYHLNDLPPGQYTISILMVPVAPWYYNTEFEITLPASPVTDTLCQDIDPQL